MRLLCADPYGNPCFASLDMFAPRARTGISPAANIFARGSRERAPIALLAKCEPMRLLIANAVSINDTASKKKKQDKSPAFLFGDPYGNRTHVFSVRG